MYNLNLFNKLYSLYSYIIANQSGPVSHKDLQAPLIENRKCIYLLTKQPAKCNFLKLVILINGKNSIIMKKQNKTVILFYLKCIFDYALQFFKKLKDSNQLEHPQPNINLHYYKRR